MAEWKVWIMETTTDADVPATEAATTAEAAKPKRTWLSIGDEETTFEGVTMSLAEAQRRSQIRDVEDAMRSRRVCEEQQRTFHVAYERNVVAQERQARALESIAAAVRTSART